MTGGAAQSNLVVEQHSNITGLRVVLREGDAVLGGAAVIAASASKLYDDFAQCMTKLNRFQKVVHPQKEFEAYHDAKYRVFQKMYEDQMSYRDIMKGSAN